MLVVRERETGGNWKQTLCRKISITSAYLSMQCLFNREVWMWFVCFRTWATTFKGHKIVGFRLVRTWQYKFQNCRSQYLYSTRRIPLVHQEDTYWFVLSWNRFLLMTYFLSVFFLSVKTICEICMDTRSTAKSCLLHPKQFNVFWCEAE